jgi:plasmid stabilization system protein ParE
VRIRYLPFARAEFREAIAWYRARSVGAARRFNEEVAVVERLLILHPRIGKKIEADVRSICVNDYPYTLVYVIEKEEIVVVALAHHSRRPGYWKDRLRDGL